MLSRTSIASQYKIIQDRFSLFPEITEYSDKVTKTTVFKTLNIRQQKDSDFWKSERKQGEPYKCLSLLPWISRWRCGGWRRNPVRASGLPELRKWSWNSKRQSWLQFVGYVSERRSFIEGKLRTSTEGPLQVSKRILITTWVWENYSKFGKGLSARIKRKSIWHSHRAGKLHKSWNIW